MVPQLNDQTVLFLTIQFCINPLFAKLWMLNSSIWPIDRTLSGITTPDLSGSGSNGNERVLHILQISKATKSPSNDFVSNTGHSLGESYPSAEM